MPRPLLSEALRGHGAVVRDAKGDRFVDELLPRDAVSRAMTARMLEQGVEHLWLDATGLDRFDARFPTIAAALRAAGLDPAHEWLPIAPAAHYMCGGIVADLDGATSLPGLWAAGEVACNGVHGSNRLASNSLLDGMVFAPRVVEAIEAGKEGPEPTGAMTSVLHGPAEIPGLPLGIDIHTATEAGADVARARDVLQRAMTIHAGVLRSAGSLDAAADIVRELSPSGVRGSVAAAEMANLCVVAEALLTAAAARQESRGAHTRSDFPAAGPAGLVRYVLSARTANRRQ